MPRTIKLHPEGVDRHTGNYEIILPRRRCPLRQRLLTEELVAGMGQPIEDAKI